MSKPGVSFEHSHFLLYWSVLCCTLRQEFALRTSTQKSDAEKPVDGAEQTDVLSAQCLACFLRAAAGNVARSPWLGEAGCPALGRTAWLSAQLFLSSTSSPRGIRDTLPPPPPQDFLALNTALTQEVAEILMFCQNRRCEAASDRVLI